ncbi:MAG: enoyl-CoA hydratase-related protein [Acidobacteriota bacterium]|nr:enoyl-CoA hydratase-related protein [Acidobacteriota bacterium]MDH3785989.1 enoyl-CoA hydratase-related protein [Acidobacteriota bacterium]
MSRYETIRIESEPNGMRRLVMDRPPVNALGRVLVDEMTDALAALSSDDDARCLILISAGKHFCAGADLKERKTMTVDDVRAFVPKLAGVCEGLAALPFPSIAAVSGVAAGGGCELALACDFRVLAESSKIGLRETALAIIPGAGGTQRLPRLVGAAVAKRWIFTAELFSAEAALRDGVAQLVATDDGLADEANRVAGLICANGPVAIRLAKQAIELGLDLPLQEALALEWERYQKVLETHDRTEALAAFAEKRPPRFEGR